MTNKRLMFHNIDPKLPSDKKGLSHLIRANYGHSRKKAHKQKTCQDDPSFFPIRPSSASKVEEKTSFGILSLSTDIY